VRRSVFNAKLGVVANWQFVWRNSKDDPFLECARRPQKELLPLRQTHRPVTPEMSVRPVLSKLGRAFIRAHHAFKFGKPSAIE